VPIDHDKFRSIDIQQRKILRDIADELGQLMSRSQPDTSASKPHLIHSVEGIDLSKALGLVTGSRPAVEAVYDVKVVDEQSLQDPVPGTDPPGTVTATEPVQQRRSRLESPGMWEPMFK
jgi:hypothetical protein